MFGRKFQKIFTVLIFQLALVFNSLPANSALSLGPTSTYIIKVTPSARTAIETAVSKSGGVIDKKFQYAFDGYTVKIPDSIANLLSKIPDVLYVEKDSPVNGLAIQQNQSPTPSWGLDRIDQRTPISSDVGYVSNFGYRSAGAGSTIYIGDTGVFPHDDLKGRLSSVGYDGFNDGIGISDCNGHGTHVATTAAGTTYGVAKKATVVPVRLLNCSGSGSYATVISALDWILSPANTNSKEKAVLNLSIGGNKSISLNEAINRLTNAGISVVAAAGNSNADACNYSPASASSAITVGATMSNDAKASYSNWGACVDINAPGSGITAGWFTSSTATNTISGTSMATPHVTGAVAVFRALNPNATVEQISSYIDSQATQGVLTGLNVSTPNKLLYVSPTDGGPSIIAPTVAFKSIETITSFDAIINFEVNPNNASTELSVDFSTDSTLSSGIQPGLVDSPVVSGGNILGVRASLKNLSPSTTYFFRAVGINESGKTTTGIYSFKTLPPPVTPPTPNVGNASNITAYSATLNGSVLPGNSVTKLSFVYSTDPNFQKDAVTTISNPSEVSGSTLIETKLTITFL